MLKYICIDANYKERSFIKEELTLHADSGQIGVLFERKIAKEKAKK